ncbi:MAG: hypothetical protein OHK0012_27840 [Synechococcales cyanobacterium]
MDAATINCAVDCVNGCRLGEECPHLQAARQAIDYINATDWDTLMETADSRPVDPLAMLDQYRVGQG